VVAPGGGGSLRVIAAAPSRTRPVVAAAIRGRRYLAKKIYKIGDPAWAPYAPAAAGEAGAFRRGVVEFWEANYDGAPMELFCKRTTSPVTYEYMGRYAPGPLPELIESESAANFSDARRGELFRSLVQLDFSPDRANAFIDNPEVWELRPIRFVGYDEKLYAALKAANGY